MQFDGVNFSPFPIEDYSGRPSLHIRLALCSRTGVLWLAFDGGTIIGVNPDFSTVSLENASLPTRSPYVLASDSDGALWMGYSDLVYRARKGQVTRFTYGALDKLTSATDPNGNTTQYQHDQSGNPVSTMITFELFAKPIVQALAGIAPQALVFTHARLKSAIRTQTGLKRFLPACISGRFEHNQVELVGWQGSGDLASVARSNSPI